jgi:hypothetical protein
VSAPTTVEWLRTAVTRVGVGSGRLGVHLGRRTVARARTWYEGLRDWVRPASGFDKGFRLGLLVGALFLARKIAMGIGRWAYHRIESGAWGPLLFMAAGVWIVAAYRAGRDGWEPKQHRAEATSEDGELPSEETPQPEPEQQLAVRLEKPPLPSMEAFLVAISKVGTPHAHLSVLAPELGTTPERLREALSAWGVPVQDVRMQGRAASTGVRGDRLPRLSAPSAGVVGAGQEPPTTTTTGSSTAGEGLRVERIGLSGTVTYDPRETVRHFKTDGGMR